MLDGGEGGVVRGGDGAEAAREFSEFVPVAVPDVDGGGQTAEEWARPLLHREQAAAVLAPGAVLDFAAEMVAHELHAVADAEDRQAEIEEGGIRLWRVLSINAGGAAAEDDAPRLEGGDFFGRQIAAHDLRIDLTLAHPPRDDLRVLRTEIEDDDARNRTGGRGASCRHGCSRG